MKQVRVKLAAAVAVLSVLGVVAGAVAGGGKEVRERLVGFEEVPAVSTEASAKFRARIHRDTIQFKLSYADLEGDVQQGHIHFGQRDVNGGISVFLCTNLGNGPAGTQACPPAPAEVRGTIEADDVVGPAGQGIDAGELDELLDALKSGVTYANVHSTKFPAGEVRAQIGD